MAKVIRYVINPDGSVTLDFNGFRGKVCVQELQKILEKLRENFGIDVNIEKQNLKPEYYQEEQEVIEQ